MASDAVTTDPSGSDPGHVDWALASATARRLVSSGPSVTRTEAADLVAALRGAAERAQTPVAETARLQAPEGAPAPLVVDRPGWIDANVASLQAMLDPVIDTLASRRGAHRDPSAMVRTIGSKVTGGEAGAVMAFVAGKVLGQYDLAPQGTPRLMLVAPNILQAEQELDVDAADFRLWVCMHEETHRVQFTAVPWLREHLITSARTLAGDLVPDPDSMGERVNEILRAVPDALRGDVPDLTQLLVTPAQREQMAKVTAVMSLLEGHADVVMDDVGPQVIPSVAVIRERFQQRRKGTGSVDRLLRRLLGLEAKMKQYRDGAVFVRAVTDEVGVDGFNAIWTSPETLPLPEEIEKPQAWVSRVHG